MSTLLQTPRRGSASPSQRLALVDRRRRLVPARHARSRTRPSGSTPRSLPCEPDHRRRARRSSPAPKAEVEGPRRAISTGSSKAMPDDTDMAGIMLELNRLAGRTGSRSARSRRAPVVTGTGLHRPAARASIVEGRFSNVSALPAASCAGSCASRSGASTPAAGCSPSTASSSPSPTATRSSPTVKATVTLDAFVYPARRLRPHPAPTASIATTPTTSPPPSGTVAAGATP